MNVRPENVEDTWDMNSVWSQAQMIAYSQIREYEEEEDRLNMYRCLGAKV